MTFKAIRQYLEDGKRISRLVDQTLDDLDPGEVVIKTQFAAVNYKDARGVMGVGNVIGRFPCIPGIEMAGSVVESTDPAFKAGDLVTVQGGRDFGMKRDGAYSEYVRVPAKWVGRIPSGTDPFESVAMGLAAYTSAVAVVEIERRVKTTAGPIIVTGGTGEFFLCDRYADRLGLRGRRQYRKKIRRGIPKVHRCKSCDWTR